MLKAVFFDLDDTLFDTTGSIEQLRRESLKEMIRAGLPAKSLADAYKRLTTIIARHGSNSEKHFDYLCRSYNVKETAPIIAAGIVAYHEHKVSLQPMHGAVHTLLRLVKRGYKLALITNGVPVKQWDKIIRLRLKEYFDVIIVSDTKRTKRDKSPAIHKALKMLHVRPQEAVFVGDKLDADIASANRCGLYSVRLLHGSHSKEKPKTSFQKPHKTIAAIGDLPDVLKALVH